MPEVSDVQKQWELFNPEEEGDPFGILDYWERKKQAESDARFNQSPMLPKSPDYAFGYSLLMGNIK